MNQNVIEDFLDEIEKEDERAEQVMKDVAQVSIDVITERVLPRMEAIFGEVDDLDMAGAMKGVPYLIDAIAVLNVVAAVAGRESDELDEISVKLCLVVAAMELAEKAVLEAAKES